jgi:hypothetical protein
MQNAVRCVVFLVVVGLAAASAFAAELRTTGFIDSIFPHWERNISPPDSDNDVTRNSDQAMFGRTRGRFFFNFIASDDLRGVFAMELDAIWGQPRIDKAGSGCQEFAETFASVECGFRLGVDINNFEMRELYVDFRIPQLPFGNRTQLGAFPISITPLHSQIILFGNVGGGQTRVTFTDQAALLLYYVQAEEDVYTFPHMPGAGEEGRLGEDYVTGGNLQLRPIDGLDLHLVGTYGHVHNPFGAVIRGNSGPFGAIINDDVNVTTESRYYLGFDSRYRIGNLSIEPFFFYLLGTRNFCAPGTQINSRGTLIPCTSPVGSPTSTDFNAYIGSFLVRYTTGPLLLQAKYVYGSGNRAGDDINNRGNGRRADVKGWRGYYTKGSPIWREWFEIMGRAEVDATSIDTFRRQFESAIFDHFGYQEVAVRPEYQMTDNLILEAAVGAFWTAGMPTSCPASVRSVTTGRCGSPNNSSGEPIYNFTKGSNFLGWEIDAGLRYSIMPGLTWTPRFGVAFYGDALAANNRNAQPAWTVSNRMIYIF